MGISVNSLGKSDLYKYLPRVVSRSLILSALLKNDFDWFSVGEMSCRIPISMAAVVKNPCSDAGKFVKTIQIRANQSSASTSSSSSSGSVDCSSERLLVQNLGNFERSGCPVRIMFFRGGTWTDYPSRVVEALRSGFADRKSAVDLVVDGSSCVFDFLRMLEIDLGTRSRRSIAWIDERSKCFFPKEFVCDDVEVPTGTTIKIDIRIAAGGEPKLGKRSRGSDEEMEVTSSYRVEDGESDKRRRLGRDDGGSESVEPRWPNAKLLADGDRAYESISRVFLPEIRKIHAGATIGAIHQCTQNGPLEKARRTVFLRQVEITKTARGSANVVHAWFRAPAKAISGVLRHGFGVSNEDCVYLSPFNRPQTSDVRVEADENGERHLMLCAVILGNVEKVKAGSQQRYPSSPQFDTGADDPNNPKWFMVWPTDVSRRILPLYVVSYKFSDFLPAPRTKYTFPELFAKIKSSLSPVKVQECLALFRTLKAGKMKKDIFIKQFRAVAGEKVLLSAIREICGGI